MNIMNWVKASYVHFLQKNNYNTNCGVFLCYFSKQLITQNVHLLNAVESSSESFRNEIKTTIQTKSKINKKKQN